MYDLETDVYNLVYDTVMEIEPNATISGTFDKIPERFPMVYCTMVDCYTNNGMRTADHIDLFSTATFDINIYSNSEKGRKQECRKIGNAIDEALCGKGFSRMSWTIAPSMNDSTVFRLTARYRTTFDLNGMTYYRP